MIEKVHDDYETERFLKHLQIDESNAIISVGNTFQEGQNRFYESNAKIVKNLVKRKFVDEKAPYLVLDPYNHTYNPAKSVTKWSDDPQSLYPKAWLDGWRSIVENGL